MDNNNNSIYIIEPYRKYGTWVFDDDKRGLVEEPFVFGMPAIINKVVNDNECHQCRFIFSDTEIPEYDLVLNKMKDKPDIIGAWYESSQLKMSGWLCPALGLYFKTPPESIYIKVEKIDRIHEISMNKVNQNMPESRILEKEILYGKT